MRGVWANRAAVIAALLFVASLQVRRVDDPDTWWHLASGRLVAETADVARTDPFAYTTADGPWINRQWLFELGLYGAWALGGAAGASLAAGALFFGSFVGLYVLLRRRAPAWMAAAVVFLAASAATERFIARPEAVTFLFLAVYLLVLDGPLGWGAVAGLVGLHALWANSHALSGLGLALIGAELASAAAATWLPLPAGWRAASARDPAVRRRLAVAFVAAALCEAATPFGVEGALYPVWLLRVIGGGQVLSQSVLEHEYTALGVLGWPVRLGVVSLLALAAAAAAVSWRRWRLSHVGIAAAALALAVLARRNVALLGFGVTPLVAAGLGPLARAADRRLGRRRWMVGAVLTIGLGVATASVVTGRYYVAARLIPRGFGLGVSRLVAPAAAVDFLEAHAPGARTFNDDTLGGYLIWRGHRVFMDGRLQVFPDRAIRQYLGVLLHPELFAVLARMYGITAAVIHPPGPDRLELIAAIARLPGWRLAWLDASAAVLLADGAAAGPPAGLDAPVAVLGSEGAVERAVERLVRPVRVPLEEAVLHWERGRAAQFLLGETAGQADYAAALRLWPGFLDQVVNAP